jgi:2-polyprenyl-3-methyl-5-hydroxy-6-metoxy-1,4-benzoquinol methylase
MALERYYPKAFNEIEYDHKARYYFSLNYIKEGDIVLDAACGVGYGSKFIADNTRCKKVVALDYSTQALQWAKEYFPSEKVSYLQANLESDEFISSLPSPIFDVVTSFETIEHLKDDKGFLERILKLLKPGGLLLISAPNEDLIPHQIAQNEFHYRHYRPDELTAAVTEAGFHVVDVYTQHTGEVIAGKGGLVNVLVCTNIPVNSPNQWENDLNNIVQVCDFLKCTQNSIKNVMDFSGISLRFNEMLGMYDRLDKALSLVDQHNFNESIELLTEVDESLCPEKIFIEALAYQGQGDISSAVDRYSRILSLNRPMKKGLLLYSQEQLRLLGSLE